jgi:hypothetical protein
MPVLSASEAGVAICSGQIKKMQYTSILDKTYLGYVQFTGRLSTLVDIYDCIIKLTNKYNELTLTRVTNKPLEPVIRTNL